MEMNRDIGDFFYDIKPTRDAGIGLTEQTIDYIVDVKGEPDWLRAFRKKAYDIFRSKPLPTHWAGDELKEIDFDRIRYYLASGDAPKRSWEDVPEDIKRTFERLGIPENERKFLAGVEAQFDSEAVYSNIKKAVSDQGVIFMGSTDALKERPDIFRKWRAGHCYRFFAIGPFPMTKSVWNIKSKGSWKVRCCQRTRPTFTGMVPLREPSSQICCCE